MAPRAKDTQPCEFSQNDFQAYVRATMREAVLLALTAVLEEEITAVIGAASFGFAQDRHLRT